MALPLELSFDDKMRALKEIATSALRPVDSSTNLAVYYRVARNVQLHANSALKNGNHRDTYIFYVRLANLLISLIPRHKDYGNTENSAEARWAKSAADDALNKAAIARDWLREEFEREAAQRKTLTVAKPPPQPASFAGLPMLQFASKSRSSESPISGPGVHTPMPVVPAGGREPSSLSSSRLVETPQAAVPPFAVSTSLLLAMAQPTMERGSTSRSSSASYPPISVPSLPDPLLPSVASSQSVCAGVDGHSHASKPRSGDASAMPPGMSPYALLSTIAFSRDPDAIKMLEPGGHERAASITSHAPFPDEPLRNVRIAPSIIQRFMELAAANTFKPPRGIETCGVLCGSVRGQLLVVTHLVIPKQRGDEDNCEMLDEDSLLNECLAKGLITIGWIHTHPSQSCFMSSLDQHTQCGYQLMLPEAIAIVVAPRDEVQPYAVYRLTDTATGSGLVYVQQCPLRGFHPHDPGFATYEHSGHIIFEEGELGISDLR